VKTLTSYSQWVEKFVQEGEGKWTEEEVGKRLKGKRRLEEGRSSLVEVESSEVQVFPELVDLEGSLPREKGRRKRKKKREIEKMGVRVGLQRPTGEVIKGPAKKKKQGSCLGITKAGEMGGDLRSQTESKKSEPQEEGRGKHGPKREAEKRIPSSSEGSEKGGGR